MKKGSHHSLETRRKMSKNNARYWKDKRFSLERYEEKDNHVLL